MSVETEPDLTVIEALDWVQMCDARGLDGCGGINRAAYIVATKCCGASMQACEPCVAKKLRTGPIVGYKCSTCGDRTYAKSWLEVVTLHPLGGAA